jgi:hypothetical protein
MLCGTVYIVKAVLHEALPNCARLTTGIKVSLSECSLNKKGFLMYQNRK